MCHSSRKRTEAGSSNVSYDENHAVDRDKTLSYYRMQKKKKYINFICVNAINFGHLFEFQPFSELNRTSLYSNGE